MKRQVILFYDNDTDTTYEKEVELLTKDEVIKEMNKREDVDKWCIEAFAPKTFLYNPKNLRDDEIYYLDTDNKEVTVYMGD